MDTIEMAELDERFMREALAEARVAAQMGEVPIGAVVVHEGKIIARAHNLREHDEDPSAHAEFSAMVAASRALGRWRLTGCTVYVTLEPCTMCAGLMVNARIDRCVYGAADPKGGALGSLYDLNEDDRLNHAFEVTAGVLEDECAAELTAFFSNLRQHGVTAARRDACADECSAGAAVSPARPIAVRRRAASRPGRSVKNVLLALDAFKGSASSAQVEQWVAEGIARADKTIQVLCVPVADGGEGTLDAVLSIPGAAERRMEARDAFGITCSARYAWLDAGKAGAPEVPGERGPRSAAPEGLLAAASGGAIAVIEMAQAAGLDLSRRSHEAALAASTYGVGQLVRAAAQEGARTIYLGLGGSATCDGGSGFLRALGARLLDDAGREVRDGLVGLQDVAYIDLSPALDALGGARVVALADVKSPLVGPRGSIAVFGPQKGLPDDADTLRAYDRWMIAYGALLDEASRRLEDRAFRSLGGVPGAGAAGGLGAAVLALGGELVSGVDAVLDLVGFDAKLADADLVITGEGMMDEQSAAGKAPVGVARRAQAAGVPVVALVGGRADELDALYRAGIKAVVPVVRRPMSLDEALRPEEARRNLICAAETLMRLYG